MTYKEIMDIIDKGTPYVSVSIDFPGASYGINDISTFQARKSVFAEQVADWEVLEISPITSVFDCSDCGLFIEILPPAGPRLTSHDRDLIFDVILSGTEKFRNKDDAEYYQDEKERRSWKRDAQRKSFNKNLEKFGVEKAFEGNEEFQERMQHVINELKDIKEAGRLRGKSK